MHTHTYTLSHTLWTAQTGTVYFHTSRDTMYQCKATAYYFLFQREPTIQGYAPSIIHGLPNLRFIFILWFVVFLSASSCSPPPLPPEPVLCCAVSGFHNKAMFTLLWQRAVHHELREGRWSICRLGVASCSIAELRFFAVSCFGEVKWCRSNRGCTGWVAGDSWRIRCGAVRFHLGRKKVGSTWADAVFMNQLFSHSVIVFGLCEGNSSFLIWALPVPLALFFCPNPLPA